MLDGNVLEIIRRLRSVRENMRCVYVSSVTWNSRLSYGARRSDGCLIRLLWGFNWQIWLWAADLVPDDRSACTTNRMTGQITRTGTRLCFMRPWYTSILYIDDEKPNPDDMHELKFMLATQWVDKWCPRCDFLDYKRTPANARFCSSGGFSPYMGFFGWKQ